MGVNHPQGFSEEMCYMINKINLSAIMLSILLLSGYSFGSTASASKENYLAVSNSPLMLNKEDDGGDVFLYKENENLKGVRNKYEHIFKCFDLMGDFSKKNELTNLYKKFEKKENIISDIENLYEMLKLMNDEKNEPQYLEIRWKAVYILGKIKNSKSKDFFLKIIDSGLPDVNVMGVENYQAELQIQARAIAGLEALNDVKSLQALYDESSHLSGLAAASLYELGHAPKNVVKIDREKLMALDYELIVHDKKEKSQ